ncbi:ABC transporter ATP-binding protein [Curtobacterium sp. MCPF17_002]|uniref:ABC transporter ATP-binding protein n=1 Tax=Curtobacterium sp. MCPF17_002 TaxID=2175645 RepID=UPI0021AC21F6|nr:ABC transporter ATP-binding protein [Curtobacterium sp. MCPF17_002]WIB78478.1 ABC transporter ATP-binding protein [Curtobacterium sp. MCPF17_002]
MTEATLIAERAPRLQADDGTTDRARTGGLVVRGLRKTLGGRDVVAGIDLDVAKGELVSLLGPSGCGKTTTLRMVAGFLTADGGSVTMGDRDVTTAGPERRPSAMVFQNYALWPHMTVTQNVAFPLRTRRVPKRQAAERVRAALDLVGLTHHATSKPAAISGGEQQRVALARAIVQEPDVLLLDEPLSNLDAKLRVSVRDEIRRIQQRLGITTVIVTHDQDEALSISDRIAVMHDGRIEQIAAPAELYARPGTRFVASFIGSTSRVDGRFRSGVGARITDADEVLVRPEQVSLVNDASLRATVSRVLVRGHFAEVVLTADGAELRAFVTGVPPVVGTETGVRIGDVLVYRGDVLTEAGA